MSIMDTPRSYAFPPAGMPPREDNPHGAAVFTTAYAFLPAGTMRDIVSSLLPGWQHTRAWIIAKPLSGFAESFAQYAVELAPGGGSEAPEPDAQAQAALLVTEGTARLTVGGTVYDLRAGHVVYLPPSSGWTLWNSGETPCKFHWIRKRWEAAPGVSVPPVIVTHDEEVPVNWMTGCEELWGTQRFFDPADIRHDFHANIVTFGKGGRIPFAETHVMEHGLYVLEGRARYLLNQDWVEVGPGDFMWLRAFCPQACIVDESERFRYLLYKDVNRHVSLAPVGAAR